MDKLIDLIKEFQDLAKDFQQTKPYSFDVELRFSSDGNINVKFYCYDICDLPDQEINTTQEYLIERIRSKIVYIKNYIKRYNNRKEDENG